MAPDTPIEIEFVLRPDELRRFERRSNVQIARLAGLPAGLLALGLMARYVGSAAAIPLLVLGALIGGAMAVAGLRMYLQVRRSRRAAPARETGPAYRGAEPASARVRCRFDEVGLEVWSPVIERRYAWTEVEQADLTADPVSVLAGRDGGLFVLIVPRRVFAADEWARFQALIARVRPRFAASRAAAAAGARPAQPVKTLLLWVALVGAMAASYFAFAPHR